MLNPNGNYGIQDHKKTPLAYILAQDYDIVITTFNCFESSKWSNCENIIFMWVRWFYHIGWRSYIWRLIWIWLIHFRWQSLCMFIAIGCWHKHWHLISLIFKSFVPLPHVEVFFMKTSIESKSFDKGLGKMKICNHINVYEKGWDQFLQLIHKVMISSRKVICAKFHLAYERLNSQTSQTNM